MRRIFHHTRKVASERGQSFDRGDHSTQTAWLALDESRKARKVAIASAVLSALAIIASVGVFAAQQYIDASKEREEQTTHGDALIGMMGGFYNGRVEGMVSMQELLAITIFERSARDRFLFASSLERNARHHQALISDIRETIDNPSSSPTYKTLALQMILLVRSIINLDETQASIIRERGDINPEYIGSVLTDARDDVDQHLRGIRLLVQVNARRKGLIVGTSCFAPPPGYNCDAPLEPLPGFSPETPVEPGRLAGDDS